MFPRGPDACTRRPLELRLHNLPEGSYPWVKFQEIPDVKFSNFKSVQETIKLLTNKGAGEGKKLSYKPLVIDLYSPTCPNLTIVDTPGITRIPLEGQDINIEHITKTIVWNYLSELNTIALCVVTNKVMKVQCDSLVMAMKHDEKRLKTIGVLSKMDIIDDNEDKYIKDFLLRPVGHVEAGLFVGIKNSAKPVD